MAEPATRRPWDVSIAAALLAVIGIAAVVVPLDTLVLNHLFVYNAVFGVGASLLLYWVLIRLWFLARLDQGPTALIAGSVLLTFLGGIYIELWSVLVAGRPFQQPLDLMMAFVHVISGALLALAFLRWTRVPAWLGWLLVVQVAVEAIESSTGLMPFGALPVTAAGILWTVFLGALAVVLITPGSERGENASEPEA